MTGGRLKRVKDYIKDEKEFCFTYGDGVSDLDIGELIKYHRAHGKDATLTGVHPPGRFGALEIKDGSVLNFKEKPKGDGDKINGGFFVLSPNVLNRITDDQCVWEQDPLVGLAKDGELMVYEHNGFWQPMDTLRDKSQLEEIWASGKAPWKTW
jgi:glucose-1-phosphate cytidylyltransferase